MKKLLYFLIILSLFVISCNKDDKESGVNLGLTKVEASPGKGFNWPYYLNVPNSSKTTTLLVLPNNTGTMSDDQSLHDQAAKEWAEWGGVQYGKALNSPVLVPTFPRPGSAWQVYTHALDRETLETNLPNLQRIDLQLIAMIDDAIERLSLEGISVDQKVFIMGFSASGMFANRFTVLHPERIKAAAIGSPGGWPVAPVAVWHGETLRYHIGVADVQQLTGNPFNFNLFRTIPLYFFMGDMDTNDSVPFSDSYEQEDRDLVNSLFGTTPVARWPRAQQIYESAGCNSQFVLYPGTAHLITDPMVSDFLAFFRNNR
jgi:pimeloyl-ACP methyl ester carboxylesterase